MAYLISRRSIGNFDEEKKEEFKEGRNSSAVQQRLESSFREISLVYISGTVFKEDIVRFKRLLFRACRGNNFILINFN